MTEGPYRIVAAAIVLMGAGISIYFRGRAERAAGGDVVSPSVENPLVRISLRIVGITLWVGVLLYLLNPQWMAWSQVRLPAAARLSGAALGMCAVLFSCWVFRSLGNNVTSTVVTRAVHRLVTDGPYRWVRHPLYTVGGLSYLSFAMLAANWSVGLLAAVVFCIIALRVPQEEQALIERYGDAYRDYARRTGQFLPKLR